jgi:CRP-like cAMP-binding protein
VYGRWIHFPRRRRQVNRSGRETRQSYLERAALLRRSRAAESGLLHGQLAASFTEVVVANWSLYTSARRVGRGGLDGPELAEALGVSPVNATKLASRLRDTVERSLGPNVLLDREIAQRGEEGLGDVRQPE